MPLQRDILLDPKQFVILKPLPVSSADGRIRARSRSVYSACPPSRDEVFWENYHRRQSQLTRQGYRAAAWRPYEEVGEPLCLEPKKLILESLGQIEETPKAETGNADAALCTTHPPNISQHNKTFPRKPLRSWRRADAQSFRKRLWRSRNAVVAVKQGRGYFHLLQDEEEQRGECWRREERKGGDLRPSVTSDGEGERGESSPWKRISKRQVQSARPFTPVHQSLTSEEPQQLEEERAYRQLCCLHWLLDTLTLDRSGRLGPLTSCWDAKDPGRSRNAVRTLKKERSIQEKWEQFVATPRSLRPVFKLSRVCSAHPLTRKSSSISVMSSVATSSSLSSLSSLVPGNKDAGDVTTSAEDSGPLSTVGSEPDPPVSEYLQKLLEEVHHSVVKEVSGSDCRPEAYRETGGSACSTQGSTATGRPETHSSKSCPATIPRVAAPFSARKVGVLDEMRAEFEERMTELTLSLTDTLDRSARNRWKCGFQRFQSLSSVPASRCLTSSVTCVTSEPKTQDCKSRDTERPYNTQWLSALLSHLSHCTRSDRRVLRVLDKLRFFTEERSPSRLSVRPHVFLRVLNSLQPWELCCPDLCVAIEIIREYVVQMSVEEYDSWLYTRLGLPQSTVRSVSPRP